MRTSIVRGLALTLCFISSAVAAPNERARTRDRSASSAESASSAPSRAPLRTDDPLVQRVVDAIGTDARSAAAQTRIARELSALGSEAVPVLLAILAGAIEPADESAPPPAALSGAAGVELAILKGLSMLPAGAVAAELARACEGAPSAQRLVALRILSEGGDAASIDAWRSIVGGFDAAELTGTLASLSAEDTLVAILARDRTALTRLARSAQAFAPAVSAVVARSVARSGESVGMDVLVHLLGGGSAPSVEIVTAIGELADSSGARVSEIVLDRLRRTLCGTDARLVCATALALARLHDVDSSTLVLGHLGGPDRQVSNACEGALRVLAGGDYGGSDAERWSAWFEAQRGWYERRGRDLVLQVGDADRGRALEAARALGARPLFQERAAQAIVELLRKGDRPRARAACEILSALGSKTAVPALVRALEHPDPGVRTAAEEALVRLRGDRLPADSKSRNADAAASGSRR